ncbi:RNA polymerase sigma factor, sigma-70 family [Brevibacterium siliguriense]|uniref:RNA polymerase sigma factor, sigma-70 family n=1 Tax=Brevibacterium siliguriense TaxID=1136497 RepID=A0A1H1Y8A8_9MICO|nr:sigma-70 family RNA polymerase sigma factor [Brevibacterium siliguriense]SDT17652.1 RNA polymerase sigma factor, sigma-70 family [Brevibacterium siliguriense]
MTERWSSSADSSRSPFGLPRQNSELSDSDLCAHIRDHRPESAAARAAYGELYARHRLPALHVALRLNRNRAQAEDAVAEAFAKIWRAWGRGKGPDESFKAYLMVAVRSESYRRTAMVRATTIVEPDVLTFLADSEPGDHAAEVAERDQLGRAFKTLPDTWQSALILIDIDGTSTADAAATMDLSSNSFSSLLRRAREGLRAAYLQEHVEPSAPECVEYSSALARFVRQQLSPKRAEAIEAHLSHCIHCRRQSFELRSINATFQAWITPAALAAALIEWGHFPEAAVLLTGAGTANVGPGGQSGTVAAEPHSSAAAAVSKSSTGTAAAGSSGGSAAGIAAGASAVKVAIAGIAASAAIAAGAATLVNLQSDPAPQSAAAAETSSAPVDPPKTTPSSPSPPRTTEPDGGDESDEGSDEREQNVAGRSAPGDAERSRDSRKNAQAPAPQEETQTPSSSDRQQPTDNDEEQEPAEVPAAEPDDASSEATPETSAPTPAAEPTDSNEPSPEPSNPPSTPSEPSSDSSSESSEGTDDAAANSDAGSSTAPSEPDAGVDSASEADADVSTAADASGASDADGEDSDEGPHCHVIGWWEFCH